MPPVKLKKIGESGIIAIDNGGHETKILSESMESPVVIPSEKTVGFERLKLGSGIGRNDFHVKWNDEWFFCGGLVRQNKKVKITGHEMTKDDDFFILSILLAIFLHGYKNNQVVTSCPISEYNQETEEILKEKLLGEHTLTVNGETKTFDIDDVLLGAETASAFWLNQPHQLVRWIDIGSRTVGYATTMVEDNEAHFIETESGTIDQMGLEATVIDNPKSYARSIAAELNKVWKRNDEMYIIGGGGEDEEIVTAFQNLYPNLRVHERPQLAQVKGLLEFGKQVFNG